MAISTHLHYFVCLFPWKYQFGSSCCLQLPDMITSHTFTRQTLPCESSIKMNQSGQRWDKYRFLPCGMAAVVEEAGPQWASGRWNTITDSNQEDSRKQEEGQAPGGVWMQCYIRTETTHLSCNLIPQVGLIQNRKNISLCAKPPPKNSFFAQSKVKLSESLPLLLSLPCVWTTNYSNSAYLSSYLNL